MKFNELISKYRGYKHFTAADGCIVFLQAILANLVVQVAVSIVFAVVTLSGGIDLSVNAVANLSVMILLQLGYGFVIFMNIRSKRISLKYSMLKTISVKTGLFVPLMFALTFIGCYLVGLWADIGLNAVGFNLNIGINFDTPLTLILSIVAACVFAPVFEELVFRGALLSGLKQKTGNVAAILLSALAFSVMHMNPQQTVYQFGLGCVLALVAIKSKSLLPSIFLHASNNVFAVILETTPLGVAFEKLLIIITSNLVLFIVLTVLLAVVCGVLIYLASRLIKPKSQMNTVAVAPLAVKNMEKLDAATASDQAANADNEDKLTDITNKQSYIDGDDNITVKENGEMPRGGILGKNTYKITYIIGVGVSVLMWLIIFFSSLN